MSTCKKCGCEVNFRMIGGQAIPLGCRCYSDAQTAGRRDAGADFCRPTKCPSCGEAVFFVRHNGGSVWFDGLGSPWPIHGCFQDGGNVDFVRDSPDKSPDDDLYVILGMEWYAPSRETLIQIQSSRGWRTIWGGEGGGLREGEMLVGRLEAGLFRDRSMKLYKLRGPLVTCRVCHRWISTVEQEKHASSHPRVRCAVCDELVFEKFWANHQAEHLAIDQVKRNKGPKRRLR